MLWMRWKQRQADRPEAGRWMQKCAPVPPGHVVNCTRRNSGNSCILMSVPTSNVEGNSSMVPWNCARAQWKATLYLKGAGPGFFRWKAPLAKDFLPSLETTPVLIIQTIIPFTTVLYPWFFCHSFEKPNPCRAAVPHHWHQVDELRPIRPHDDQARPKSKPWSGGRPSATRSYLPSSKISKWHLIKWQFQHLKVPVIPMQSTARSEPYSKNPLALRS